jgi:hypothetical protein
LGLCLKSSIRVFNSSFPSRRCSHLFFLFFVLPKLAESAPGLALGVNRLVGLKHEVPSSQFAPRI